MGLYCNHPEMDLKISVYLMRLADFCGPDAIRFEPEPVELVDIT